MQNQLLSLLLGQNNQAVGNLMAVAQSAGLIDIAMQGANSPTNKMGQIANLMKMLRSGNPEQIAQQMMQSNPQFRQFVEANKGKTPEQVAKEYGLDWNAIMGQFR